MYFVLIKKSGIHKLFYKTYSGKEKSLITFSLVLFVSYIVARWIENFWVEILKVWSDDNIIQRQ